MEALFGVSADPGGTSLEGPRTRIASSSMAVDLRSRDDFHLAQSSKLPTETLVRVDAVGEARLTDLDRAQDRVVSGVDSQFLLSHSWREEPAQVLGHLILTNQGWPHGPHRALLLPEFRLPSGR